MPFLYELDEFTFYGNYDGILKYIADNKECCADMEDELKVLDELTANLNNKDATHGYSIYKLWIDYCGDYNLVGLD